MTLKPGDSVIHRKHPHVIGTVRRTIIGICVAAVDTETGERFMTTDGAPAEHWALNNERGERNDERI